MLKTELISNSNIENWLKLYSSKRDDIAKAIQKELVTKSDRLRILLYDSEDQIPCIGAVIEFNPSCATIWTPLISENLELLNTKDSLTRVLTEFSLMCIEKNTNIIKCTVKNKREIETIWCETLIATGFIHVSTKCRFELKLNGVASQIYDPEVQRINAFKKHEHALKILYDATCVNSLDRTTEFELSEGFDFDEHDIVFVVEREGYFVGLCVLELEASGHTGWVKYVGTIPSFRRTGIARNLLSASISYLSESNVVEVHSLIDSTNYPSIALHNMIGFTKSDECGDLFVSEISK